MKCNQCGKDIPETNRHSIIVNGTPLILCGKHYSQYVKFGHFLDEDQKSNKDSNEYEITTEGVWIYTFNRRKEPSGKFLIDLDDLDRVISKKWRLWQGRYYTGNYHPLTISRFIMNPNENEVVDHINGNPADNRKSNLRITTQQNNLLNRAKLSNNSTGIAGVWFDKKRNRWCAEIKLDGVKCMLGRYTEKSDAAFVRYYAETRLFGVFRSTRNDQYLIPLAQTSTNKENLIKYVDNRLLEKYSI